MERDTFYLLLLWWIAFLITGALVLLSRFTEVAPVCTETRDLAVAHEKIEELEYRLFWLKQTNCGDSLEGTMAACGGPTDEVEDEERVARETPYTPPD